MCQRSLPWSRNQQRSAFGAPRGEENEPCGEEVAADGDVNNSSREYLRPGDRCGQRHGGVGAAMRHRGRRGPLCGTEALKVVLSVEPLCPMCPLRRCGIVYDCEAQRRRRNVLVIYAFVCISYPYDKNKAFSIVGTLAYAGPVRGRELHFPFCQQ